MINLKITRVFFLAATLAFFGEALSYAAHENVPDMEHGESVTADIPFVGAMNNLDASIKEIVSAVVVGDSTRVLVAVEAVYGIMDKVHASVRAGSVKLRKNAGKTEEFTRMEREFQGKLEKLADAAKKNNWEMMVSQTKEIIGTCARCHQQFK